MLNEALLLKALHDSHSLQASSVSVGWRQLMVLAMIRAQVVLPTPRGPQNRKACAKVLLRMAFFKVDVMDSCPTTVSKVAGLYFLADTTKFSISFFFKVDKSTNFQDNFRVNEEKLDKKRKNQFASISVKSLFLHVKKRFGE